MSEELKNCPFCGGKCDPKGWLRNDGVRGPECEDCGASAESVERWNTRSPLSSGVDHSKLPPERKYPKFNDETRSAPKILTIKGAIPVDKVGVGGGSELNEAFLSKAVLYPESGFDDYWRISKKDWNAILEKFTPSPLLANKLKPLDEETIRRWWRFDNNQKPLSSWHEREDFIQKFGTRPAVTEEDIYQFLISGGIKYEDIDTIDYRETAKVILKALEVK